MNTSTTERTPAAKSKQPVVAYYLGRPAALWLAALSKRANTVRPELSS